MLIGVLPIKINNIVVQSSIILMHEVWSGKAYAISAQMLETITYESWGDMGTLSNHRNHTYEIIRYSQKWHNKLYRKLIIYVCVGVCVINEAWRYDFMLTFSMKLSCIGATIDPCIGATFSTMDYDCRS